MQPGDSLWQIAADRLGDGARYTEIAQLNYDRVQPDGQSLTSDHWLHPAGSSRCRADAAAAPASQPPGGGASSSAGDTLWDIAEDHLGKGSRYPEIAAASAGIVQHDGARLTDPDLIRPGWTLTVPGVPDQPVGPAPVDARVPAAAPPPPANGATPPRPDAPDRPGPSAAGHQDQDQGRAAVARPSAAAAPRAPRHRPPRRR